MQVAQGELGKGFRRTTGVVPFCVYTVRFGISIGFSHQQWKLLLLLLRWNWEKSWWHEQPCGVCECRKSRCSVCMKRGPWVAPKSKRVERRVYEANAGKNALQSLSLSPTAISIFSLITTRVLRNARGICELVKRGLGVKTISVNRSLYTTSPSSAEEEITEMMG